MNNAVAFLSHPAPTITKCVIPQNRCRISESWKIPSLLGIRVKHPLLKCTNLPSWETSPLAYAPDDDSHSVIKESNIFESLVGQETNRTSVLENEDTVSEIKNQSLLQFQPLKWPMWLLGPSILLATGMVPSLWLPLSSVFLGPNIAGLLSLIGLDCIFNMGATLFLLMADACGRPKRTNEAWNSQVPRSYRLWNMGASVVGFAIPIMILLASNKGLLQPQIPFISFAVLLGPYLLLLSIQMLTEMLTWHWKSPVWLVTPIVYEAYRVLQLMRGLRLGGVELGAPAWVVESIRGLVCWWILILGMQLMRVAWFVGFASRTQSPSPQ